MKKYKAYLFDFDYTLADSSRGIVMCFRHVLDLHRHDGISDEEIKRTIGKTLEESFSILTGITDPATLASYKKEYVAKADTCMTANTRLFPETADVLHALKKRDAMIGIISTKFRYRIMDLMDRHFPAGFLDIVVGGEDVKASKPSPEGLLYAISKLGCNAKEALYIGDSTVDALTAEAAGTDFFGVTHGATSPEELARYPHIQIAPDLSPLI